MSRSRLQFVTTLGSILNVGAVPLTGRKWAHHPNGANGWHGLAPRRERFQGGYAAIEHAAPAKLEINQQTQPWQKHATKLQARKVLLHLGWNERRIIREDRNARARLPLADQKAA